MTAKEVELQRLFATFAGGLPGIGLLMLRAAVGITAAMEGGVYLTSGRPTFEIWFAGVLVTAAGISLLIGFLTPLAGALVALASIAIARSWLPPPTPNLLGAPLSVVLVVVIAAAVALLGPGTLSVDCRLFGRREIIIPPRPTAS